MHSHGRVDPAIRNQYLDGRRRLRFSRWDWFHCSFFGIGYRFLWLELESMVDTVRLSSGLLGCNGTGFGYLVIVGGTA